VFHVMVGTVSSGWWAVIPRDRGHLRSGCVLADSFAGLRGPRDERGSRLCRPRDCRCAVFETCYD
jgi:hypothetical protein